MLPGKWVFFVPRHKSSTLSMRRDQGRYPLPPENTGSDPATISAWAVASIPKVVVARPERFGFSMSVNAARHTKPAKVICIGLRGSTGAVMAQRVVGGLFAALVVVNEHAS